jgi:hypothetical protein
VILILILMVAISFIHSFIHSFLSSFPLSNQPPQKKIISFSLPCHMIWNENTQSYTSLSFSFSYGTKEQKHAKLIHQSKDGLLKKIKSKDKNAHKQEEE